MHSNILSFHHHCWIAHAQNQRATTRLQNAGRWLRFCRSTVHPWSMCRRILLNQSSHRQERQIWEMQGKKSLKCHEIFDHYVMIFGKLTTQASEFLWLLSRIIDFYNQVVWKLATTVMKYPFLQQIGVKMFNNSREKFAKSLVVIWKNVWATVLIIHK